MSSPGQSAHDWVSSTTRESTLPFTMPDDLSIPFHQLGYKYTNDRNARCDDCRFDYHAPVPMPVEFFAIVAQNHLNDQPLCAVAICHFNFSQHLNGEDAWVKKCILKAAKEMSPFSLKGNQYRFERRRYETLTEKEIPNSDLLGTYTFSKLLSIKVFMIFQWCF